MGTTSTPSRAVKLAEKTILGFIAGAAAAIGVIEVVLLVGRIAQIVSGGELTVRMPLMEAPAELAAPGLVDASYDSVSLTLASVPASARPMLVAADVLGALIPIGVCAVLAWLCVRVFVGRPFVRSVTWSIAIVGLIVLAGGLGGATGHAVANAEIAEALDLAGSRLPTFVAEVPMASVGWAAALIVVAAAFEIGQRMQRETEGLV